ncbi:uncharacterized protein SCHCODRAFT_02697934 [Schizophyllum commune H4-8]|nr:uncharacterized protein SCHCODRAFT_02697934 [Schizophyllum commune H4-8]KAI5896522.1 hypothetical protein SCHCODRAFT_02697934 [Schizophyllum commune H4-8]
MSATDTGQPATSAPAEPPWTGWIETTGDALLILEAARRGLIPRVTRRLVEAERKMITSGAVFVFDEDESGIKRWTDGFYWSPSRILGNFLLYRETDKKGIAHRSRNHAADEDGGKHESQILSRPKKDDPGKIDKARERSLMGSLTNSYKFKQGGLMKKTFSVTIGGVAQHLISYYSVDDVANGRLRPPSSLPELASLDISPEYLDKTHFRNPPKIEVGPDGRPRYRGEADDIDTTSAQALLSAPLSSAPPLLGEARTVEAHPGKRSKRYDPYGATPAKRPRTQGDEVNLTDPNALASQSTLPPVPPPATYTTSPVQAYGAVTYSPASYAASPPPQYPYAYPPASEYNGAVVYPAPPPTGTAQPPAPMQSPVAMAYAYYPYPTQQGWYGIPTPSPPQPSAPVAGTSMIPRATNV